MDLEITKSSYSGMSRFKGANRHGRQSLVSVVFSMSRVNVMKHLFGRGGVNCFRHLHAERRVQMGLLA